MSNIIIADENKVFYDYDLIYFLEDIKSGKINNSDVKKAYNNRISRIENNLANAKEDSYNIRVYKKHINDLKNIIFRDDAGDIEKDNKDDNKRSPGKGLNISSLPILLSKLNTNSSKKLISDIEQLIKNLYDNKQITKQVYNSLIKSITYKNDSQRAN